jgi:hypothetical protein
MPKAKPNKPAKSPRTRNRTATARTARRASTTASSSAARSATRNGTASTTKPLAATKERFAQQIALGATQIDAYRRATGSKAKDSSAYVEASKWAKLPQIRLRVQELVAAVKSANEGKLVYRWEEAMGELDQAKLLATLDGEHSAVISAIKQKCRISGLEVDPRSNAQKPFEGVTDDELDAEIEKAKRQVAEQSAGTRH